MAAPGALTGTVRQRLAELERSMQPPREQPSSTRRQGSRRGGGARTSLSHGRAPDGATGLILSLEIMDGEVADLERRVDDAAAAIDAAVAEGDRISRQRAAAEDELARLCEGGQDGDSAIARLKDLTADMEEKLTSQRERNLALLSEVGALQERRAESDARVAELNCQILSVNAEVADCKARTAAAKNAAADGAVAVQERMAERHRRLAEIDAQMERLRSESQASGDKQRELAELRRENDALQGVVDRVMGALTAEHAPDGEGHDGGAAAAAGDGAGAGEARGSGASEARRTTRSGSGARQPLRRSDQNSNGAAGKAKPRRKSLPRPRVRHVHFKENKEHR